MFDQVVVVVWVELLYVGVGLNIIINSVKLDWLIKRHICKFGHTQRQKNVQDKLTQ